jgi:catechol 2,3-dioxygenase-like lactoylglutathione lyase family enzyme
MLDHIGLKLADLARSRGFYEAALQPLGISAAMVLTAAETGGAYAGVGFGRDGKPQFWISADAAVSGPIHVAFAANDRRRWRRSTAGRWRPAGGTMAGRDCGRTITRAIMARSCSIPTATTWKRCATSRCE